jgi:hypothetical protein
MLVAPLLRVKIVAVAAGYSFSAVVSDTYVHWCALA